jgi:hypothetical protein
MHAKYFFVFDYGFGSFGVAADTLQEARTIFRKSIDGDLDLECSFPKEEEWKKKTRRQKRTQRFKDSGLDIDLIEPEIYQS